MKRLAVLVSLSLALLALAAAGTPRAAAKNPDHILLPAVPFDLPALPASDGICAFPVHGEPVDAKEFMTVTTLPDGTIVQHVRGSVKLILTNEATGKSITVNASGPGYITFLPTGAAIIQGEGTSVYFYTLAQQQQFGVPGLAQFDGPFTQVFAPDGTLTSLTPSPHVTDLCAALA